MHALDIVIALVGIFFVFIGIKRGLIGELIRLAAMVAGVFVAFLYYQDFARSSFISKIPLQSEIRNALSFIVLYLLCAVAIIAAGWGIKKVVHCTPLGMIDRILGALIGGLKTLLIAYVACLSISTLPVRRLKSDFKNSIVFSTYQALPKTLSLKSLLKKKTQLRTIFNKKPSEEGKSIHKKISDFKAVVDSAKEAQAATKKE